MKQKILKLSSIVSGFAMTLMVKAQIYADDIKSMLDGEGAAGSGGALEGVNNMVDSYGKGAAFTAKKVGIYIICIAVIVLGIKFVVGSGNANSTAENKKAILPIVGGTLIVFGVVGIIVFLSGIGDNMFSAA